MFKGLKNILAPGSTATGKGKYFEIKAMAFLKKNGLKDFLMNYRCRWGEIDLVAYEGEVLVFIEVRYRAHNSHGNAAATVNFRKQDKIRRSAQHFLQKNGLTNRIPCRFDVLGITGRKGQLEFHWIRGAF